jgi:serine/threonine-protein kinase
MAAVYAGTHRNGHSVAIKILHERLLHDCDAHRRFRREAQLTNAVNHPSVVPVIDDDITDDGCLFLVMPLLEGETLRVRWERHHRKLEVGEVIAIASELLDVLAAAHLAKIIHRDIKPENVFVMHDDSIRVLDFGVAHLAEEAQYVSRTCSGRAVGTPAFMAPEQALGRLRAVDARTDLWAVGATMFSLLTGRFVHEAETAGEIVVYAATRPPPRLGTVAPDLPAELCAVVDRALAFEREARWPDASAMNGALREAFRMAFGRSLPPVPRVAIPRRELVDIHELSTYHHDAHHAGRVAEPCTNHEGAGETVAAADTEHTITTAASPTRPEAPYGRSRLRKAALTAGAWAMLGGTTIGVAALLPSFQSAPLTPSPDQGTAQAPVLAAPTVASTMTEVAVSGSAPPQASDAPATAALSAIAPSMRPMRRGDPGKPFVNGSADRERRRAAQEHTSSAASPPPSARVPGTVLETVPF